MSRYCLSHLSDPDLLRSLHAAVARERYTTADLLAHLAEVDARKLYLPVAYPSMFAYCVGELRLAEDAAYKRIQAARVARQFPVIFTLLADGRLHLTGVGLLAPHLTAANAGELLAAATGKTKAEIERLLAERFPRTDLLPLAQPLASPATHDARLAPAQVGCEGAEACQLAPAQVDVPAPRSKVTPTAPERYALQLTIGKTTHDKLRYAQALLGHQVPSGELAEVLDRVLSIAIADLERRKFAACQRPHPRHAHPSANPRHIPAEVRRTVWERDGGQCTFVSEAGHRCPARTRLEFDHAEPVARGGQATMEGIRLRCRAHNQHEAERVFGAGFMDEKRRQAQEAAAEHARAAAAEHAKAAAEVVPWLRALGFRADEAKRAAETCGSDPDATLEQRLRAALSSLVRPHRGRAA